MNYIKNHKGLIASLFIVLIIIVFAIVVFTNFFLNKSNDVHGNRFGDRAKITDVSLSNLEKALLESEYIESTSISYNSGIINIIIDVKKEVSVKNAKELSKVVLENLDEKLIKDYDLQIYLTKKTEELEEGKTSEYPLIGYKHKNNSTEFDYSNFTW